MPTISCFVQSNGTITDGARKDCATAISKFPNEHINITIEKKVEYSSESQREYYFAVIVEAFINHFAQNEKKIFNKEQMHDSLMRAVGGFSNPYVCPFTGEPDAGRISYTKLTKSQTDGYHTLCRQEAAIRKFDIKEPNEG